MTEVMCPHCGGMIIIEQINCGIFVHAIYRSNGEQINPHTSGSECECLIRENLIWGCGKLFRFDGKNITVFDYI